MALAEFKVEDDNVSKVKYWECGEEHNNTGLGGGGIAGKASRVFK